VAVLGALILGLSSNVKAQTTTFYCIMTLTDTCNGGGYHGNYDVVAELWISGGGQVCIATGTTTAGTHCVALTGSFSAIQSLCTYMIKLTKVQRSNGTCANTTTQQVSSLCWSYIATCNSNTPQFTVSL